jgi:hypothetical protein
MHGAMMMLCSSRDDHAILRLVGLTLWDLIEGLPLRDLDIIIDFGLEHLFQFFFKHDDLSLLSFDHSQLPSLSILSQALVASVLLSIGDPL